MTAYNVNMVAQTVRSNALSAADSEPWDDTDERVADSQRRDKSEDRPGRVSPSRRRIASLRQVQEVLETSPAEILQEIRNEGKDRAPATVSMVLSNHRRGPSLRLVIGALERIGRRRESLDHPAGADFAAVFEYLDGLRRDAGVKTRTVRRSRRSSITSPGTVVSPDLIRQRTVSVDGLPRQLSTVIREQLKRDYFAIAFFGPPQCGITSMLQLVTSEARKKDFECSMVGLHLLAPTRATSNKPEASGNLGRESQKVSDFLSGQLAAKWGFKEGLPRGGSFVDWLHDALEIAPHRSRLAVIDSLTSLEDADIVVVLRLIRSAVETHSQEGTIPVSWCVGLSYISKQEWDVVSEVSRTREFSPPIEVGWLNLDEAKMLLLETGGQSLVDQHASTLFRQYGGQPYLTHLAAVELASGGDPQNVFERALAGEGRFGHRVNAVRRLIMPDEGAI